MSTRLSIKLRPSATLRAFVAAVLATTALALSASASTAVTPGSDPVPRAALPVMPVSVQGQDVRSVPLSIDRTGTRDVSHALQAFLDRVPDGVTVLFPERARYRLDRGIELSGRHNLVLVGHRTALVGSGCGVENTPILVGVHAASSNIVIGGFRIIGSNSKAGTGAAYTPGCEYQMGVAIYGSSGIEIVGTKISRVRGDCVYIGVGADRRTWSSDVSYHDSQCVLNGRAGVAITAGCRILVENVTFNRISYLVFNIEPNRGSEGATDITFRNNEIGSYDESSIYSGYVFAANGSKDAMVDTVTVTGNVVTGGGLRSLVEGGGGSGRNRRNITFADNRSTMRVRGPVAFFSVIDGLTISGNRQPLSNGKLASVRDCTGVTYID